MRDSVQLDWSISCAPVATIGIEPGVVMAREEESMVEVGVAVLLGYLGTPITVTVISTDSTATSKCIVGFTFQQN